MMTNMLTPLLPVWEEGSVKDYGEIPCNLSGGPLTIHCKYGNILKNPSNAIYYKCNMESSGVELRINGRAIEHGLFDRVWGEAIQGYREPADCGMEEGTIINII